jgi:murein DD-endopeptidase MepM/ murein hydrolase activator NlpD
MKHCMKPPRWFLPLLLTTPAVLPLLSAVADNFGAGDAGPALLAALPPGSTDKAWVPVRQSITIEELASQLGVDETRLARLNGVNEDHRFGRGDWLAVPDRNLPPLDRLASLDASQRRSSPPEPVGPEPSRTDGVVHLGDTLAQIASRYGMTLAELLRLNPGLETARLVVGSQIRLAQSAGIPMPPPILGINPVGSGGVSWPDQPDYGQPPSSGNGSQRSFIWPTEGVFTSGYGWRWGRMHKGIDLANNVGTPIRAVQDGQVSFAGWDDGGYGYLVKLTHADGSITVYAHNSRILVQQGESVRQGQTISLMGSTGRSTGPHLHFEVRPAGRSAVNPLQFLPPRA